MKFGVLIPCTSLLETVEKSSNKNINFLNALNDLKSFLFHFYYF